jgi:hypothetical protein
MDSRAHGWRGCADVRGRGLSGQSRLGRRRDCGPRVDRVWGSGRRGPGRRFRKANTLLSITPWKASNGDYAVARKEERRGLSVGEGGRTGTGRQGCY